MTQLLEWVLGNDGRHEAPLDHRPEPVLDEVKAKARAAAVIAALVTALSAAGVSTTDAGLAGAVLTVLAGVIIAVAQAVLTIRAAYAARARVTPLSDPRDLDGQHLVISDVVTDPLDDAPPTP